MNFKILIVCLNLLLVQQCAFSVYLFPIPHFIFGDALYNYDVNRSQLIDTNFRTGFIDQVIDHFDMRGDGSATFEQRYFYKNEYFRERPYDINFAILELMGPDGTPFIERDEINEWAKSKSALYFKLEHRYYGKSRPTKNLTTRNLVFTEYAQSLVDAMNFIKEMEKEILEAYPMDRLKWVITGRGYGGMLAAWFAAKYSHQYYVDIGGAIAIDSPMEARVSFTDFFEIAQDLIRKGYQRTVEDRTCVSYLHELRTDFFSKLATDSESLMQMFNLCTDPKNILDQDSIRLQQLIFGVIPFIVQYNRNILYSSNYGYGNLCKKLSDISLGSTVLERFGTFIRDLLKLTKYQCIDYTYERLVKDLSIENWSDEPYLNDERIFFHQRCAQFGWFIKSHSSDLYYNYTDSHKLCTDVFGKEFSMKQLEHQVQNTNRETGGDRFKAMNGSAIFFVNGGHDIWHNLKNPNPDLLIAGASHCAFLSRVDTEEVEPAEMDAARQKVKNDFLNRILGDF